MPWVLIFLLSKLLLYAYRKKDQATLYLKKKKINEVNEISTELLSNFASWIELPYLFKFLAGCS